MSIENFKVSCQICKRIETKYFCQITRCAHNTCLDCMLDLCLDSAPCPIDKDSFNFVDCVNLSTGRCAAFTLMDFILFKSELTIKSWLDRQILIYDTLHEDLEKIIYMSPVSSLRRYKLEKKRIKEINLIAESHKQINRHKTFTKKQMKNYQKMIQKYFLEDDTVNVFDFELSVHNHLEMCGNAKEKCVNDLKVANELLNKYKGFIEETTKMKNEVAKRSFSSLIDNWRENLFFTSRNLSKVVDSMIQKWNNLSALVTFLVDIIYPTIERWNDIECRYKEIVDKLDFELIVKYKYRKTKKAKLMNLEEIIMNINDFNIYKEE